MRTLKGETAANTASVQETQAHRLILPGDSNHHGTLYAGALLRIALEAAYATAVRFVGAGANVLLRRVLSVECYTAVPVGSVVEVRGRVLHLARAYLVIGLIGMPLKQDGDPWMDGLMGFVQVDGAGKPAPFDDCLNLESSADEKWSGLVARMTKLMRIR